MESARPLISRYVLWLDGHEWEDMGTIFPEITVRALIQYKDDTLPV